jgi:23S rRNA pseudouridine1911/1915/1917 synthase
MDVVWEDNHLLVLNKPAELPTMGVEEGEFSLLVQAKDYLKQKYKKPGNVYLGVVSRLDAASSGVIVFARTSKAAARLTQQFREGTVGKQYWAIVAPPLPLPQAEWKDWMRKDERNRRMEICPPAAIGAQRAQLSYRTLRQNDRFAWLEVRLDTGRKHQIRVQCASRYSPVIGDTKYGSHQSFASGIALHARRLELDHPTQQKRLTFEAPPPSAWKTFIQKQGWPTDAHCG